MYKSNYMAITGLLHIDLLSIRVIILSYILAVNRQIALLE